MPGQLAQDYIFVHVVCSPGLMFLRCHSVIGLLGGTSWRGDHECTKLTLLHRVVRLVLNTMDVCCWFVIVLVLILAVLGCYTFEKHKMQNL